MAVLAFLTPAAKAGDRFVVITVSCSLAVSIDRAARDRAGALRPPSQDLRPGCRLIHHRVSSCEFRARLSGRQMTLEVTGEARSYIARQGFDPVYGARPPRRFIAREVETRIGRALLARDVRDGAVIRVGLAAGELAVSYENPG
jgi:C-terminal, D2-small domain, of ClpB protein